ncbi:right-handed parallel beta-helix repeat-containing protein [Methylocystis sp. ATCC 49242]|uniref:right-handed parallel beta-helix repeat-containing protein n=1 Tax=Methylocystis sp. ATCC 49242 TaxID=622637 RepID=UPI0001F8802C|nr:right-handed parallel beta-helix repeat-containing protein [Methylocystis sp. ATCC 49242]
MTFRPAFVALAAISSLGVAATPALALSPRVFVSGKGANAAGCGTTAPCRTFQYALAMVSAGGEIVVMDSGDYGPVRITKSVSIVSDSGGVAGITQTGAGAAIDVAAGVADKIVLRGLTVDGAGAAAYGLRVTSAASVDVTDCAFRNFRADGIHVNATGGPLSFSLSKVDASDNRASGMFVTGAYKITGRIADSNFDRNGINGFYALNYQAAAVAGLMTQVAISGGEAHGNAFGYRAESTVSTSPVHLTLDDVTASKNSTAGVSSVGNILETRIMKSVIAYNRVGARGVKLTSAKNNVFSGNTTDLAGALGAAPAF